MTIYRVEGPDGAIHRFEGPDDATPDQVTEAARLQFGAPSETPRAPSRIDAPPATKTEFSRKRERSLFNWDYQEPQSYLGGLQNALTQGISLSGSDEIGAAGRGTGGALAGRSAGEAYDRGLAEQRGNLRQFREDAPISAAGGEMLGSMASIPAKVLTAPKTMLEAVKAGAGLGAGYGGLAGFLGGEGWEGRGEDAAIGAGTGGAIGGALPLVVGGATSAVRRLKEMFGASDPTKTATRRVLSGFAADKVTPDEALSRYEARQAVTGPKPEMMFETGGENLLRKARGVANMPGRGTEVAQKSLEARQALQTDRVSENVWRALKTNNQNFYQVADDLTKTQIQQASPVYKEAFKANQVVASPAIDRMLRTPAGRSALQSAAERMQNKMALSGAPDPELAGVVEDLVRAGRMHNQPEGVAGGLKLKTLDLVKQEMDDMIGSARRRVISGTERQGVVRDLTELKSGLVKELDRIDQGRTGGLYARARAIWAGPARGKDALELGRSIMKEDAEVTAEAIRKLSPSEKDFFRIGVSRALTDTVKSTGDKANAVRRIFGNEATREKLQAAFPSHQDWSRFRSQMFQEQRMFENAAMVGPRSNSKTEPLRQDIEGMGDEALGEVMNLAGQSRLGGFKTAAIQGIKEMLKGPKLTPAQSAAASDILFAQGKKVPPTLRALQQFMDKDAMSRAEMRRLLAELGGRGGGATGQLLTRD